MDNTEDNGWHPPNASGLSIGHESGNPQRILVKNIPIPQNIGSDSDDDDDEDDEDIDEQQEEEEEEDDDDDDDDNDGENGVQRISNTDYGSGDGNNDEDDYDDGQKHPKKRRMKSLLSYEFAPRVPSSSIAAAPSSRPATGGRNSLTDWTEHETFKLLDAWGDKFLQHGRKSLRSEEWLEVAEKVSRESKVERSDTQCRNRLDTLKKKYKKEKLKIEEDRNSTSKWVYFKKLDMLLSTPLQQTGVSCGMDSGEYVFMSPKVYLNHANGLDEMTDSSRRLALAGQEESDSEGLPPKKSRNGRSRGRGASFKLLADSIQKFADVYEKAENNKRQQLLELENMRMNFHRELEMQKRQILERAQEEIALIRRGHDEQNDVR
ncbi:DNA-binding transcription factor [Lithospermum erythrorhizon]|uniref:DNA-binding transcription factor n=1 Tax=Lithospermum erythrorhizon TaxID=34254 RepID=A0AAV3RQI7_LITER